MGTIYLLYIVTMEDLKKKSMTETDKEIVFSKAIKAGKRIYYVDVRKNKKDDMFLAITESKKVITGDVNSPAVSFEKHKIFLYKEDFGKFMEAMNDVIAYIDKRKLSINNASEETDNSIELNQEEAATEEIKLDIDF